MAERGVGAGDRGGQPGVLAVEQTAGNAVRHYIAVDGVAQVLRMSPLRVTCLAAGSSSRAQPGPTPCSSSQDLRRCEVGGHVWHCIMLQLPLVRSLGSFHNSLPGAGVLVPRHHLRRQGWDEFLPHP